MEFALVSMIFLALLLGTIDMARLMWELNSAKAATRAAVRMAVVNQPATSTYVDFDATAAPYSLAPGDPIPTTGPKAPPTITCTSAGCTCTSDSCSAGTLNAPTFNRIVSVVRERYSRAEADNIVVEYRPIGLGFAGNPYGPDVEPLVTVRLCNDADTDVTCTPVEFAPGVLQAFGVDPFDMPPVASSLSGEDLS